MSTEQATWDDLEIEQAQPETPERHDDRVIEGVDLHLEDGLDDALEGQESGVIEP